VIVGLLQPGEMGATVGNALVAAGHEVVWASEGRSEASRSRAQAFTDVGTAANVAARAEVVFSIVPPHAALETARALAGYAGIYVDANAIAPATAREVGSGFARFVDAGIIGGPPEPRLYLSTDEAETVAALFAVSPIAAPRAPRLGRALGGRIGLALGRRDGRDRRGARSRGLAGRLP
jgi:hypothetical protein